MLEQVLDKLEGCGVSREKTKKIRDESNIHKQIYSVTQSVISVFDEQDGSPEALHFIRKKINCWLLEPLCDYLKLHPKWTDLNSQFMTEFSVYLSLSRTETTFAQYQAQYQKLIHLLAKTIEEPPQPENGALECFVAILDAFDKEFIFSKTTGFFGKNELSQSDHDQLFSIKRDFCNNVQISVENRCTNILLLLYGSKANGEFDDDSVQQKLVADVLMVFMCMSTQMYSLEEYKPFIEFLYYLKIACGKKFTDRDQKLLYDLLVMKVQSLKTDSELNRFSTFISHLQKKYHEFDEKNGFLVEELKKLNLLLKKEDAGAIKKLPLDALPRRFFKIEKYDQQEFSQYCNFIESLSMQNKIRPIDQKFMLQLITIGIDQISKEKESAGFLNGYLPVSKNTENFITFLKNLHEKSGFPAKDDLRFLCKEILIRQSNLLVEEFEISKKRYANQRMAFSLQLSGGQIKKLATMYEVWKSHQLDDPTSLQILFDTIYESIVRHIGVEHIFKNGNVLGFLENEFGKKFISYAMAKRLKELEENQASFSLFESFIKDLEILSYEKNIMSLDKLGFIQGYRDKALKDYFDICQSIHSKDIRFGAYKSFAKFVLYDLKSGNQGVAYELLKQLVSDNLSWYGYRKFIDYLAENEVGREKHLEDECKKFIVSTLNLNIPKLKTHEERNNFIAYVNECKAYYICIKNTFNSEEIYALDAAVEKVAREDLRENKVEIEKLVATIDAAITLFESSVYLQSNLKRLKGFHDDVPYLLSLESLKLFKSFFKKIRDEAHSFDPEAAEINWIESIKKVESIEISEGIKWTLTKKFREFKKVYTVLQEQIAGLVLRGEKENQKRFTLLQKEHNDVLYQADRKMQALFLSAERYWEIRETFRFSQFKMNEDSRQAFLAHEKGLNEPLQSVYNAFGEMTFSLEKSKNEFEAQSHELKTCLDDTTLTLAEQAAKIYEFAQKRKTTKLLIEAETKKHSEILEKLTTEAKNVLVVKADDVKKEFKDQINICEKRKKAFTDIQGVTQGLPGLVGQMLPQLENLLKTAKDEFEAKEGERDRANVLLWLFDNMIFSWLPFVASLRKFREEQQKLAQYSERLATLKSGIEPLQTLSTLQMGAIISLNQKLLGDMDYFDDRVTQLPTLNSSLQMVKSACDTLKNTSTLQTQILDTALTEVNDELRLLREAEEIFTRKFAEQQYQNQLAEYRLKARMDKASPLERVLNDSDMSPTIKKRYLTDLMQDGDAQKGELAYNVNRTTQNSKTLLHMAIQQGSLEMVEFLVKKGANVNAKVPMSGNTPLHKAILKNNKDLLSLLLSQENIQLNLTNTNGQTPLALAVETEKVSLVKLFLERGEHLTSFTEGQKNTLLYSAIREEDDAVFVEKLFDEGARVGLYVAARYGRVKALEVLLRRNIFLNLAYLDLQNLDGNTPLHVAIYYGHMEVAEQLINAGAAVNRCNKRTGNTPLHLMARTGTERDFKLLQVWINKQQSSHFHNAMQIQIVNMKNAEGNTVLHLAMESNNINLVDFLIKNGADIHIENNAKKKPFETSEGEKVLEQIIKDAKDNLAPDRAYGQLYEQLDKAGVIEQYNRRVKAKAPVVEAPLPVSAQMLFTHYQALQSLQLSEETQEKTNSKAKDKCSLSVKLIIVENALRLTEASMRDGRGNTILHTLAAYNDRALGEFIKHYANQQEQVWIHVLNATNHAGETSLHSGVREKQVDFVKFLLAEGIDKRVSNKEQQTAWEIAFKANDVQMIALLQTQDQLDALIPTLNFNDELLRQFWMEVLKKTPFKQQRLLLNAKDKNGNTLLHAAVQKKALEDVHVLTHKYAADVSIKNAVGQSSADLAKASQDEKMESLPVQVVSLFTEVDADEYTEGKIYKNIDAHTSKYRRQISIVENMRSVLRALREQYTTESYKVLTQIVGEEKHEPLTPEILKSIERLREKHGILERTLKEVDGVLAKGKVIIATAKTAETFEAFIKECEAKIKRFKDKLVAVRSPKEEVVSVNGEMGATKTLTTDFKTLRKKFSEQRAREQSKQEGAEAMLRISNDIAESTTTSEPVIEQRTPIERYEKLREKTEQSFMQLSQAEQDAISGYSKLEKTLLNAVKTSQSDEVVTLFADLRKQLSASRTTANLVEKKHVETRIRRLIHAKDEQEKTLLQQLGPREETRQRTLLTDELNDVQKEQRRQEVQILHALMPHFTASDIKANRTTFALYALCDSTWVDPIARQKRSEKRVDRLLTQVAQKSTQVARKITKEKIDLIEVYEQEKDIFDTQVKSEKATSKRGIGAVKAINKWLSNNQSAVHTAINAVDNDGNTLLHLATQDSMDVVVAWLLPKTITEQVQSFLTGAQALLGSIAEKVAEKVTIEGIKKLAEKTAASATSEMAGATVTVVTAPLLGPLSLLAGKAISSLNTSSIQQAAEKVGELMTGIFVGEEASEELTPLSSCPNVNQANKAGDTPLHIAARDPEKLWMVLAFLEADANVNCKNNKGETPLHVAVRMGNTAVVEVLVTISKQKMLNVKNNKGETPLHIAVQTGDPQLVTLLIDHGADRHVQTMLEQTALDLVDIKLALLQGKEGLEQQHDAYLKMRDIFMPKPKAMEEKIRVFGSPLTQPHRQYLNKKYAAFSEVPLNVAGNSRWLPSTLNA